MYKHIRVDYYHFRVRKGRADVLLQRYGGDDRTYCIPFHYVERDEGVLSKISSSEMEDDGDLVIVDCRVGESHIKKLKDKEWIPLSDVLDKIMLRNDAYHVFRNIFRLFLAKCPLDTEQRIRSNADNMLDTVLTDIAKQHYVDRLQRVLEGERVCIPDCSVSQPNPELLKKEISTLEHFRLERSEDKIACNRSYSYEPIDWEAFGCKIRMFKFIREPSTDREPSSKLNNVL